jgi:hypothetical protein
MLAMLLDNDNWGRPTYHSWIFIRKRRRVRVRLRQAPERRLLRCSFMRDSKERQHSAFVSTFKITGIFDGERNVPNSFSSYAPTHKIMDYRNIILA